MQYFFSVVNFRIGSFGVGRGRKMLVKGCEPVEEKIRLVGLLLFSVCFFSLSLSFFFFLLLSLSCWWVADLKLKTVVEQKGAAGSEREHRRMGGGELLREKKNPLSCLATIYKTPIFSLKANRGDVSTELCGQWFRSYYLQRKIKLYYQL